MVLGTFQKAFSQERLPKCQFPKWHLIKCTCNFAKVRLGPLMRRRLQLGAERCGQDELGARAPRKEQAGGRALPLGQTWEIAHLGLCLLGKT